ncbi:MAG: SusF/SusE family outer membrane protein [Muribaculaceae bacterium]|nr:SusF/SusE family outer membrane protein [Muribaculaceae bacterium]
MKKLHIFCAMALGLALASCDQVEENFGQPQSNPQEAPFGTDAVTVTPANSAPFVLADLDAANATATLATSALAGAPDGYTLSFKAQMTTTEDFAGAVELPVTTTADGTVTIAPDELQTIYSSLTKDPREATVYIRYAAFAVANKTTLVRMGGDDFYYGPYAYKVKPFDASKEIADGYTLELAAGDDFSAAQAFPFNHSAASPYDDPAFSVVATFTDADFQAGLKWRVVSSTGVVYGPAGAADAAGDLMEGAPAGTVVSGSPLLMTIDMEFDTYEYKQAYECMYTPGTSCGWVGSASQTLTTTDYETYTGLVVIESGDGFKFNPDPDWNGHDVGVTTAPEKSVAADGTITFTGVAKGSNNIKTDIAKGLFYVEFNYSTKEFKLTYLSTLGIIGGFNGWGESLALQPSADMLVWTSPATEFPAGCEWKIRANDGWDYNWGGTTADLQFNAGNIVTDEAGTYVVTLNFSSHPYTATVTKQ